MSKCTRVVRACVNECACACECVLCVFVIGNSRRVIHVKPELLSLPGSLFSLLQNL